MALYTRKTLKYMGVSTKANKYKDDPDMKLVLGAYTPALEKLNGVAAATRGLLTDATSTLMDLDSAENDEDADDIRQKTIIVQQMQDAAHAILKNIGLLQDIEHSL